MRDGMKNAWKRIVSLGLALLLVLSLSGCASQNTTNTATGAPTEESIPTESPSTNEESPVPEETPEPTVEPELEPDDTASVTSAPAMEPEEEILSATQRNSINMLNYMTVLTQEVNEDKGNQLFLESAYSSLVNDIYPNAVDTKTQAQITSLMDTIDGYRMIAEKRRRLEYIYEQNRAQAMKQAIPSPVALLSVVQSGSLLKAAASVLYMAVDSVTSYQSAVSQADLQFIKDGWELDDASSKELHNSTKNALSYMFNMVRDYDLPGDYALNQESVEDFVFWSSKPKSQLVSKIAWLESHEGTYSQFGPYWLELATDYYDSEDYEKCLASIRNYESVTTRIFRKDIDYATALPMAILSAKETMDNSEYVKAADNYCSAILKNTKDADWSLRYFAAQIYLDLYSITNDAKYLDQAYKIAFDNVNVLVDEQRELNASYLSEYKDVKPEQGATEREKKETNKYNQQMKEERKIALPPVSEALYLNCELLFALAEQRNVPASEKTKIEAILHESGSDLFLTTNIDNRFWFEDKSARVSAKDYTTTFEGAKLSVPAVCVADRSVLVVTVSSADGKTILDDWRVTNVDRHKSTDVNAFTITYESEKAKGHQYKVDDVISIKITPASDFPEDYTEFKYHVIPTKVAWVFDSSAFERITE